MSPTVLLRTYILVWATTTCGAENWLANVLDLDEDSREFVDDLAWQTFQSVVHEIAFAFEVSEVFNKGHHSPLLNSQAWVPLSTLLEIECPTVSQTRPNLFSAFS